MSYLIAIVVFGLLVFVHELGHFVVAKLSGIHVLQFTIGFGPAILKKEYKGTVYALRLLPLGGAVMMQGEDADEEAPIATQRPARHLRPIPVEYLDPSAIATLREVRDTPEFLRRMIAEGTADIERIDQALSLALMTRELTAVHRQAHALRGVSLSVGAVRA